MPLLLFVPGPPPSNIVVVVIVAAGTPPPTPPNLYHFIVIIWSLPFLLSRASFAAISKTERRASSMLSPSEASEPDGMVSSLCFCRCHYPCLVLLLPCCFCLALFLSCLASLCLFCVLRRCACFVSCVVVLVLCLVSLLCLTWLSLSCLLLLCLVIVLVLAPLPLYCQRRHRHRCRHRRCRANASILLLREPQKKMEGGQKKRCEKFFLRPPNLFPFLAGTESLFLTCFCMWIKNHAVQPVSISTVLKTYFGL